MSLSLFLGLSPPSSCRFMFPTQGCLVDFDPPLETSDFSIPDTERLSFLYILEVGGRLLLQ